MNWTEHELDWESVLSMDTSGPQEFKELFAEDLERICEREEMFLERALEFVTIDPNSAFYADPEDLGAGNLMFYRDCRNKLREIGVRSVKHLIDFLEDPYPNRLNIELDETERFFYKKAISAYDLLEK